MADYSKALAEAEKHGFNPPSMNNPTYTVETLIESLKAYPKDLPVYLEVENGNTIPWTGQITAAPEDELSVMAKSPMAIKIHTSAPNVENLKF